MITVKELIEQLKSCDPNAYVAAYSSVSEDDSIIEKIIPEVHPSEYGVEEYGCNGYSMVGEYIAEHPDAKFVVIRD